jgi:hypothetical protein
LSSTPGINNTTLQDLIQFNKQIDALNKEISRLKLTIANCKQFNKKVELNLMLKVKRTELASLFNT